MTTYKEIKGTNIEVLESDPSNPLDGQVWYNSTDNVLKGNVGTPVVAWSTVNSLNQARTSTSGAGTATAAIMPRITITIISSTKVKPSRIFLDAYIDKLSFNIVFCMKLYSESSKQLYSQIDQY